MCNKYDSLKRVTNWIKDSSSDEFMSTFTKLDDNYSGVTIGDFIDSFIDDSDSNFFEYDILTTGNFIFGAEESTSESKNEWKFIKTPEVDHSESSEFINIKDICMIDNKQKYTNLYDATKDDTYSFAA